MLSGGAEVSSAGLCGFWNCTLGSLHPGPGESWFPGRVAGVGCGVWGGGLTYWWDGGLWEQFWGLAVIRAAHLPALCGGQRGLQDWGTLPS